MARLNLFTELKYMETVLDERTELSILRAHYRFSSRSPFLLLLMALNLANLGQWGRQRLNMALCIILLLLVVIWPMYQLQAGVFRLELPAQVRGRTLRPDTPGTGYYGLLVAVYALAGGLFPLPLCALLGFYPDGAALAGLYLLGVCCAYLALCAAHGRYVRRAAGWPAPRANAPALAALCLLAAAGAALVVWR